MIYTFDKNQSARGQLGYYSGAKEYKDAAGNYLGSANVYAADTHHDDLKIVLLSKSNGRLRGTFSGVIKHAYQDDSLKVENGTFNIAYTIR